MRRLRITRRRIPLDCLETYEVAWRRVRATTPAAGVRAWLFRRAGRDDAFIEFLEWNGAPELDGAIEEAVSALEEVASGETELCEEVESLE
jgi:hypothetical protein